MDHEISFFGNMNETDIGNYFREKGFVPFDLDPELNK